MQNETGVRQNNQNATDTSFPFIPFPFTCSLPFPFTHIHFTHSTDILLLFCICSVYAEQLYIQNSCNCSLAYICAVAIYASATAVVIIYREKREAQI